MSTAIDAVIYYIIVAKEYQRYRFKLSKKNFSVIKHFVSFGTTN